MANRDRDYPDAETARAVIRDCLAGLKYYSKTDPEAGQLRSRIHYARKWLRQNSQLGGWASEDSKCGIRPPIKHLQPKQKRGKHNAPGLRSYDSPDEAITAYNSADQMLRCEKERLTRDELHFYRSIKFWALVYLKGIEHYPLPNGKPAP